jgi:hypothetical protein
MSDEEQIVLVGGPYDGLQIGWRGGDEVRMPPKPDLLEMQEDIRPASEQFAEVYRYVRSRDNPKAFELRA